MGRFETRWLTAEKNLSALADLSGQWIDTVHGCRPPKSLQLHALAYNLGKFLRTLATPEPIKDWSLTTLKEKLIKIGAKVVICGRVERFGRPLSYVRPLIGDRELRHPEFFYGRDQYLAQHVE